jgi:hypothetical protein
MHHLRQIEKHREAYFHPSMIWNANEAYDNNMPPNLPISNRKTAGQDSALLESPEIEGAGPPSDLQSSRASFKPLATIDLAAPQKFDSYIENGNDAEAVGEIVKAAEVIVQDTDPLVLDGLTRNLPREGDPSDEDFMDSCENQGIDEALIADETSAGFRSEEDGIKINMTGPFHPPNQPLSDDRIKRRMLVLAEDLERLVYTKAEQSSLATTEPNKFASKNGVLDQLSGIKNVYEGNFVITKPEELSATAEKSSAALYEPDNEDRKRVLLEIVFKEAAAMKLYVSGDTEGAIEPYRVVQDLMEAELLKIIQIQSRSKYVRQLRKIVSPPL